MIRFKLGEQLEKKQFRDSRRITMQEMAEATGVNRSTLSKLINQRGYSTGTDVLDSLCKYFECRIEDLRHLLDQRTKAGEDVVDEAARVLAEADTGDLIFFSGTSFGERSIKLYSRSVWTHVGIVFRDPDGDSSSKLFLAEADVGQRKKDGPRVILLSEKFEAFRRR